ncbi:hypothetical protein Pint_32195 [Pistacia integerrima]|uniref:Uncharacterized protein n=1 Tax=Pistacia integerrima TaxID=434235 RepID=A0ACC0XR08_9ROSI|nr:hypothetical protein Pint_32195 [Pistacia integerrima]
MMMRQSFFAFSIILLFSLYCNKTFAQPTVAPLPSPTPPSPTASPPAPPLPTATPPAPLVPAAAPGPSGPTNVTKILEKAKGFSLLIRLLKSTSVSDQIEKQLNDSNNGVTIFAPTDGAFSSLSSGVLNSLNDEQKEELVQFHVISSYIPLSQFQTVSNPLRTNAGDTSKYTFPLNVTTYPNSVNISTGITNTSLSGTVYSDGQLAIYQVDKVLLPWNIFGAKPPAPAPSPTKRKKENDNSITDDNSVTDSSNEDTVNASGAMSLMIITQPAASSVAPPTPPSPTASPPLPKNTTPLIPAAGPVADQIEKQLNDPSNGMTIFAPSDSAFSSLSSGFLNSLNDEQKEKLVQFHVISSYIPLSQFQTVSNPVRTNAGDTSKLTFPVNVTAYPNSVNISTGITNTSLSGTVYRDGQLAVYQVDKVLLPWNIFCAKPPAPAPSPTKRKKEKVTMLMILLQIIPMMIK